MGPDIRWLSVFLAMSTAIASTSYGSGGDVRAKRAIIQADIERARITDAYNCAPKELALAEGHFEFAQLEYDLGDSSRAMDHLKIAEKNVREAIELSKDCGPKKIVIAAPKPVLKVQKVDQDGDGIADLEDACPTVPGSPLANGCPIILDTDGDNIPDEVDRCPYDPEDVDEFEDEDGCPDPDNDSDGVLDVSDACPYEAGVQSDDPAKNGCPVYDRDGDGILDDQDACPDVPGIQSADPKRHGCPDRDGDKIFDMDDACPDQPGVPNEDPKKNGCPIEDRDGDGILDDVDACPDKPGVPDKNPKKNGCPRVLRMVVLKADKIEIKQQINFKLGKATIQGKKSFQILDEVALVLSDTPRIKKIRVEGHTDSTGKAAFNKKLSQNRAQAVMDYLIKKGIEAERMEAVGFGPDKPLESNKTAKGRAKNRRTEFNIIEQ